MIRQLREKLPNLRLRTQTSSIIERFALPIIRSRAIGLSPSVKPFTLTISGRQIALPVTHEEFMRQGDAQYWAEIERSLLTTLAEFGHARYDLPVLEFSLETLENAGLSREAFLMLQESTQNYTAENFSGPALFEFNREHAMHAGIYSAAIAWAAYAYLSQGDDDAEDREK